MAETRKWNGEDHCDHCGALCGHSSKCYECGHPKRKETPVQAAMYLDPCPKCHAWRGDPCRTPSDRVTLPHSERVTDARTDQTAQGEAGREWECWTCTAAMYGDPEVNARFKVGPLAIDDHVAAGHDVRRVEGKA